VIADPSLRGKVPQFAGAAGTAGGYVAPDRGVCTDAVIRAMRSSWGIDLQLAGHHNMQAHFATCRAI
jgi:uncharacterized protein YijF (DUF1287 family)